MYKDDYRLYVCRILCSKMSMYESEFQYLILRFVQSAQCTNLQQVKKILMEQYCNKMQKQGGNLASLNYKCVISFFLNYYFKCIPFYSAMFTKEEHWTLVTQKQTSK